MVIISGKCDPKGKGSKCMFCFWKLVKQRTALTIKMLFFFLIAWTAAGLCRSCMGTVGNGKADITVLSISMQVGLLSYLLPLLLAPAVTSPTNATSDWFAQCTHKSLPVPFPTSPLPVTQYAGSPMLFSCHVAPFATHQTKAAFLEIPNND